MPNAKNKLDAGLQCGICEVSFRTKQEKEEHLRLHCILCKVLCASRNELIDHMRDKHYVEAGAAFWPLHTPTSSSVGEDDGLSKDERDFIEYKREHSE